ncbi:NAD(P)-dependent glycerol-3-phosphate dehydrogenase [Acetobacter farinalis]|uniref:Glycerol-3-phosphate dehydrogenase [NAD(P)+] n=1 Tax=Acetobacter farinalis TaxID=1260984 RepID=A0ABT3Q6I7_9PROT|nr:NAD(P)H-dependent glycerol-3-phosphate dehydrogenase [Acetobacter farinalis]MCX2560903.1 NAD(P)-dependent glycerol-3-phosphate dehydrogenase [Acetobacter farinalis]NHO29552.1 NAD(P)H-dependent glycerol-3-phosphate dehydrogenase [Acetobacter farinalis]
MKRIAVIGAGAWGTALALHAARTGAAVHLWARTPAARLASGAMPRLSAYPLPETITVTDALTVQADMTLVAVPMQHLPGILAQLDTQSPIILCCKGVEPENLHFPLDSLERVKPGHAGAVLSGPNFAHEIAEGLPAAAVLAAREGGLARALADGLGTPAFRLYDSTDTIGVQLGGAAKNVIAIAAGVTIGAGLGENARAALVTRGLAEISRLAQVLGGNAATISGLSGMGDLLLTCTGTSSRNFRVGHALGQGLSPQEAERIAGGVAEGVVTAQALARLACRHQVSVPVMDAVAAIVTGRVPLQDLVEQLLARPAGPEMKRID